jgi:predicted transcriptional regulator of viral defense system
VHPSILTGRYDRKRGPSFERLERLFDQWIGARIVRVDGAGRYGVNVNVMMTNMPSSREVLFRVSEARCGWFRAADAVEAGVPRQQLARYVDNGVLRRSAQGVYRFRDFPAQPFEDVIEACLWAGPDAVASHDTALAVYGLGEVTPSVVHVNVPRRLRKRRDNVIVHTRLLTSKEVTVRDGVPVTAPARTLRDSASDHPAEVVEKLIEEAEARGLVSRRVAKMIWRELSNS